MDVSELDYELPEERIAQRPVEPRSAARMLVVDRELDTPLAHRRVRDLPQLLPPCLLVANDTRVLPARLRGRRRGTGGRVELLLLERHGVTGPIERWGAMGRANKPLRPGHEIELEGGMSGVVLAREGRELEIELRTAGRTVEEVVEAVGRVPLPPYIRRPDDTEDRDRYQTVFAATAGAVAAPTAGLHFDEPLLAALGAAGHELVKVTLHVGAGTFAPVRAGALDAHEMHEERYHVSEEAVEAVRRARAEGRPVVAIGTTVVRTLESAGHSGELTPGAGRTKLFIRPGYRFRVVDGLLTNFHLPRSTLLALVMALAGTDKVRSAYRTAVESEYRFFSYGDAMLIPPRGR